MANKEIEKRFLVTELHPDFLSLSKNHLSKKVKQGFVELANPNKNFRVRIINGDMVELATKSGRGMVRDEEEYKSHDVGAAEFLFANLVDHWLEKTRYIIDDWEIDFFNGSLQGIVLAEREFKQIKDVPNGLQLPSWIGQGIEVTDSLTNHHLARLATLLEGTDRRAIDFVLKKLNLPIPKIVITGPPCSGKSKILDVIKKKMPQFHCVPEVASIIMGELGVRPDNDELSNIAFQKTIYSVQDLFEATSVEFAISSGKAGCILDRGTVDNLGYFPGGLVNFVRHLKTTLEHEYRRYRAVICLQVAPSDVYKAEKKNNPNRTESYKEACDLEEEMIKAWKGHPNFYFIKNGSDGWAEKERRVLEIIESLI